MATPNHDQARAVLKDAFSLARSEVELPTEWIKRTERVGQSSNLTFVAALGTALLARATDPEIDPLTLQVRASPAPGFKSYSARSLAKEVLADFGSVKGVHLGRRGAEPLNNQPFFGSSHISRDLRVHASARPDLEFLVETVERIRDLPKDELPLALAAFLRVRYGVAQVTHLRHDFSVSNMRLDQLVTQTAWFVTADPESGRRGQALVAAILDFAYPVVEVGSVHDPSRHYPGDVRVFSAKEGPPALSIEVKQVALREAHFYRWAQDVAEAGIPRSMVVALDPSQPPLDGTSLTQKLLEKYGVLIEITFSAEAFLHTALARSATPLQEILERFPRRMQERLQEMDVRPTTIAEWGQLFEGGS